MVLILAKTKHALAKWVFQVSVFNVFKDVLD